MKLITEKAIVLNGYSEEELNEATGITEKNYYISGIFSTPEAKNRNGRVYSRHIWEREVEKYQLEIQNVSKNTLCEYNHPPRTNVDEMKAVARIVELKMDSTGNVIGKAKILNDNTELTNKLKGLIKEGIKIGVSSRGVGKVSATGIVEDYKLITYDVVPDPSDYNAMLNGVVEGYTFENGVMLDKEFQIDESGCIGEICDMPNVSESSTEKCPIQEKIDMAISEVKNDIYNNISKYMEETIYKINEDRDNLIQTMSDFLEEANININVEKNIENIKKSEKDSEKELKESLLKIAEQLKNQKEEN